MNATETRILELENRLADAHITIRALVGAWLPDDPDTIVPNPPPGHHWLTGLVSGVLICVTCPTRHDVNGDRATTPTECLTAYRARGGAR